MAMSGQRRFSARSCSSLKRLQDLWFAPKRFESTTLYERLGVVLVKRMLRQVAISSIAVMESRLPSFSQNGFVNPF